DGHRRAPRTATGDCTPGRPLTAVYRRAPRRAHRTITGRASPEGAAKVFTDDHRQGSTEASPRTHRTITARAPGRPPATAGLPDGDRERHVTHRVLRSR